MKSIICKLRTLTAGPGGNTVSASRVFRMLAVALALAAMLCVTAASVSPAHIHLNDPADRCDICVTAHLSVRNVAFVQIAQPVLVQSFLAPPPPVQRFESRGILVSLTRGPPSSL